ncbi:MAG: DNA repair protein RadA [Salibacteraceae bacterium]|jgi:DNA repair protein RadA/Sms|nr:DNA repair protein RadA [Salibacteraceae bacterium]MDP4686985.1 DNA repair protein RadA [Salibacteraceae bacterium]MDP4763273.1 DNA repair protein RadA [Salibacteraceae bacterium]MDP4844844.1 DNA repair protein RadA [Salibacteraceae bacterium]MDP4935132.1 DNA repair protein RadA [Salibacteraceae bacterium]
MAKTKTAFVCQSCGSQFPKWMGKCSSCGEWNSLIEEVIFKENKTGSRRNFADSLTKKPIPITQVKADDAERIPLPDEELTRVLGGGIVPGSVILIGGDPGIGKSTLLLQLGLNYQTKKILYVSGEESANQIKMRAERIGNLHDNLLLLTDTSLERVMERIEETEPDLVIIDSIQTMQSAEVDSVPGSVAQIRECTGELIQFAKETDTPVILIGHITKEGNIAGPKVMEHMVDVVLQFEGDRQHLYRLLRSSKNRFGSTNELGIYEMQGSGLKEVSNPSQVLMSQRDEGLSGSAIAASMEGARPMMIEVQALVGTAAYGTPQRTTTGFDQRRLHMLLAVLEKRCGLAVGKFDVFLNMAGGIRVDDPAIDMAAVCAALSSSEDYPIPAQTCFAGEVGLSGEIRPVTRIEQRIKEAEKLGFDEIYISAYGLKGLDLSKMAIKVRPVKRVDEVFGALFG